MAVLKNILLIVFFIVILSQAQAVEPKAKSDAQVEGKQTKSKNRPAEIKSLIECFAKGQDDGGRAAYKKAVQIGNPAVPYLKEALNDSRKNVRFISVQVLGAIGGQEAADALVLALQDPDKDVRRYAAWFLGECGRGNEPVIPALTKALSDACPEVVWHSMKALEQLNNTSYKENVLLVEQVSLYLRNPDPLSREYAAKALRMIGSPKTCEPLVNALASEKHGSVAFAIKEALVRIRSQDAVPLLLALLRDSTLDRRVYPSAAEVLREFGDLSINDKLLALTKSQKIHIRQAATEALGFPNNTQAISRLVEITIDCNENSSVRYGAIGALGSIGHTRAVDALDETLNDESAMLRRETAKALGEIRCPQAVDALIKALNDSNVYVVMYATKSLGRLGDKKAAKPIVELFDRDLPDAALASNPLFANLPTVAHHALVAIMKENVCPQKIMTIHSQDQLKKIREAWRRKLGIQETAVQVEGEYDNDLCQKQD